MSLASNIECDAELVETLRLVLSKISPKELEIYAASSAAFAHGGFRFTNINLIRARILSLITAPNAPIEERLRKMLREQIRRSLEAGGGNVHTQKQLEAAQKELVRLKGVDERLEKVGGIRAELEKKVVVLQKQLDEALSEVGPLRQRAERAEAALMRNTDEAERRCSTLLQARLAEEMAVFFKTLPKGEETGIPHEERMHAITKAITDAPDKDLSLWRGIVNTLAASKVISKEEQEVFLSDIHRRYTMLHMQGFELKYLKDGELQKPRGVFMQGIAGQLPVILLIDAHNTLFALQSRYRLPNEAKWPTAKTRQWLVDDIVHLLAAAPTTRAYIVFDGPERTESTASANVSVIYSGGAGEHRADRVLVDQARFLSESGVQNLLIITNDGELSGQAVRHGAKNLAPTDLLAVL